MSCVSTKPRPAVPVLRNRVKTLFRIWNTGARPDTRVTTYDVQFKGKEQAHGWMLEGTFCENIVVPPSTGEGMICRRSQGGRGWNRRGMSLVQGCLLSFPSIIAYAEAPRGTPGFWGWLSGRIDPGVCSPSFWPKPTWEAGREWEVGNGVSPRCYTACVVLYAINCQKCT